MGCGGGPGLMGLTRVRLESGDSTLKRVETPRIRIVIRLDLGEYAKEAGRIREGRGSFLTQSAQRRRDGRIGWACGREHWWNIEYY